MSIQNKIIAVDLDGVCSDFYGRMREIAAEWFEKRVDDLPSEVTFRLKEWGIKTRAQYNSLHRFAVTQRALFETSSMIPGARKYLRKLSNEHARIRIITSRLWIPYFHAVAVSQTINWLDKYGIPYWDLCFMKQKEQVGADVYIDDSPDNIKSLRDRGFYTICFGNTTNVRVSAPRVTSWEEAYNLIHRKFDPGKPTALKRKTSIK